MIEFILFIDGVFYNSAGLLFVALGIMVLIRHTGFPDLTVDGSFTIGAAVFALLFSQGFSFFTALFFTIIAGMLGGGVTAFCNQILGISRVVASVLSMTILILSAPYITDGATISLLKLHGIQASLQVADAGFSDQALPAHIYTHFYTASFWLGLGMLCAFCLYVFLKSRLGIFLRYVGSAVNPSFMRVTSINRITIMGLLLGNALVAMGGAIEALKRGAYTSNMGLGTILLGLTIVILGEAFVKSIKKRDYLTLQEQFLGVFLGLLIYSMLLQLILSMGLDFVDLKLVTTVLLLLLLGIAGHFFPNSRRLF